MERFFIIHDARLATGNEQANVEIDGSAEPRAIVAIAEPPGSFGLAPARQSPETETETGIVIVTVVVDGGEEG